MTEKKTSYVTKGTAALLIAATSVFALAFPSYAKAEAEYITEASTKSSVSARARIDYNLPGIPSRSLSYYSKKTGSGERGRRRRRFLRQINCFDGTDRWCNLQKSMV